MKNKDLSAVLVTAGLFFAAAGLMAQTQTENENYKTMLEDAMRSGKYTTTQVENWDVRVKRVSGSVSVKAADAADWSPLEGEVPLEAADLIKTGADGAAELYFEDKAAILIGRGTQVELASVTKTDTALVVKAGFLAGKIGRLLNEKFKVQVRLPSTVCAMRAAEFALHYFQLGKETGAAAFSDDKITVTPMDGKGQNLGEYPLEKSTELTFTPDQRRLKVVPLAKMMRYSGQVATMRQRLLSLKKTWKPMNQTRRKVLRDRVFKRVTGRGFGEEEDAPPPKPKKKLKNGGKTRNSKATVKKSKKAAKPKVVYEDPEAE